MKRRRGQLDLDDEPPDEERITKVRDWEIWYYRPNPPPWHRERNQHPCPTCCSLKTTLMVVDDGQKWGWCNACGADMVPGERERPEPAPGSGPNNQPFARQGERQLELLR